MLEKKSFSISSNSYSIIIDEPTQCPICKAIIKPQELSHNYFVGRISHFIVYTFLCKACMQPFMTLYELESSRNGNTTQFKTKSLVFIEPMRYEEQEFTSQITEISPDFIKIYNQALAAESASLDQIAGIGYRKALEFLIKDFLIKEKPDDENDIKEKLLGKCIQEYVDDPNLKITASRAAWLGNDQTHYVQKFTDMDINDLKRLIKLSTNWIEIILLTRETETIESRR